MNVKSDNILENSKDIVGEITISFGKVYTVEKH